MTGPQVEDLKTTPSKLAPNSRILPGYALSTPFIGGTWPWGGVLEGPSYHWVRLGT